MADIENFWLFLATGLALNLTPGADMLYVIDRTIAGRAHNGIAAAFGIFAGCMVHLLLAAVGITALLAASPAALSLLKYAGAIYLAWLGISLMRSDVLRNLQSPSSETLSSIRVLGDFIKGVAVNVLNPKIALFFVAFLPQFIRHDAGEPVIALVTLGLIFNVVGTALLFVVVWGAAKVRAHLAAGSPAFKWYPRVAGALMLALGCRLALTTLG